MSTGHVTQKNEQEDSPKAKMFHFARGLVEGFAGALATVVVASAAAAAGTVALAAVGAAAGIVGAVGVARAYRENFSATAAKKFINLGRLLGFALPFAAGLAAYDNPTHQTEAPPAPAPVSTPAKSATITCPAETMVQMTESFNAAHNTTLTLPNLKQADCTISAHQPAP